MRFRASISLFLNDCRSDFVKNIVLCGGGSMVSGLPDRLVKELNILSTEPGSSHGFS